jgi:hypothetical protein
MNIALQLDLSDLTTDETAGVIGDVLETLIARDRRYLAAHPMTPRVYLSGVKYRANPGQWLDVPSLITARFGDCKDLSAWRIAELREMGEEARAHVVIHERRSGVLYHVQVRRPGGAIEDPAKRAGMVSLESVV